MCQTLTAPRRSSGGFQAVEAYRRELATALLAARAATGATGWYRADPPPVRCAWLLFDAANAYYYGARNAPFAGYDANDPHERTPVGTRRAMRLR